MKISTTKTFKTIAVCVTVLLLVFLVLGIVILKDRIKTMRDVTLVDGDLYALNYSGDYYLDDILLAEVRNAEELCEVLSSKMFFGYPISVNEYVFGCSAFLSQTVDGRYLVGRNFDYGETESLLVYCNPENGYSSYSMVDLDGMAINTEDGVAPTSLFGRVMMWASPYACVEGMNEKGLTVALLELQTEPTQQDNGNPDIMSTVAVRMLLDKCSTTEEAIAMLGEYDMFSLAGMPYHFFIADAQGSCVVVEWPENTLTVVDASYCTNFQLAQGKDHGYGIGQERYATIETKLRETSGVLTEQEAMDLLQSVQVGWDGEWCTQWSAVYNLNDFTVSICNDMDYQAVYTFMIQNGKMVQEGPYDTGNYAGRGLSRPEGRAGHIG